MKNRLSTQSGEKLDEYGNNSCTSWLLRRFEYAQNKKALMLSGEDEWLYPHDHGKGDPIEHIPANPTPCLGVNYSVAFEKLKADKNITSFNYYSLDTHHAKDLVSVLDNNKTIEKMELDTINAGIIAILANAIQNNRTLKDLTIMVEQLSSTDVKAMQTLLKNKNDTLQVYICIRSVENNNVIKLLEQLESDCKTNPSFRLNSDFLRIHETEAKFLKSLEAKDCVAAHTRSRAGR